MRQTRGWGASPTGRFRKNKTTGMAIGCVGMPRADGLTMPVLTKSIEPVQTKRYQLLWYHPSLYTTRNQSPE